MDQKLAVDLRYLLTIVSGWLGGWLLAKGYITVEQMPTVVGAMVTVAIAAGSLGPYIWAKYIQPTPKAMEAARQIDARVAPSAQVEIVTPGNAPNIIVPGTAAPSARG